MARLGKKYRGGFEDHRGQHVRAGDRVRYLLNGQEGTLLEALQDGDASVRWDTWPDGGMVKWNHLMKVPKQVKPRPAVAKSAYPTHHQIRGVASNLTRQLNASGGSKQVLVDRAALLRAVSMLHEFARMEQILTEPYDGR